MPSSLYVKKYGGKFYIVFDDTDPERVVSEAYESIKKDLDWIFGNVTEYIASSDRMEIYYKYAEKMINSGKAYVCTCSQEEFKKFAGAKKECPCRKINTKENSERWKKMLDKKGYNEGEAVLRFKLNMKDPNPAMRDFPLARINAKKHARQGKKYRVWPLMNLVVPIDDMEFGMTHIIRGKDHMDNAKRQEKIFEVFGKKYPWAFFVGRIKFSDLELSKRKIIKKIEEGEYSGWDDERLPTVASLRKRGFKPEAFAKFVEQRGLSEVDKVITTQNFFKIIDIFGRE
jgi:glutamyl-tRNA synthetase